MHPSALPPLPPPLAAAAAAASPCGIFWRPTPHAFFLHPTERRHCCSIVGEKEEAEKRKAKLERKQQKVAAATAAGVPAPKKLIKKQRKGIRIKRHVVVRVSCPCMLLQNLWKALRPSSAAHHPPAHPLTRLLASRRHPPAHASRASRSRTPRASGR